MMLSTDACKPASKVDVAAVVERRAPASKKSPPTLNALVGVLVAIPVKPYRSIRKAGVEED